MAIRLATSQFSTSGDFLANEARMCRQIVEARKAGADIVHFFAEARLSGYAGHDLPGYPADYDWALRRPRRDCSFDVGLQCCRDLVRKS